MPIRGVQHEAWAGVLYDLQRLGASPGEMRRIQEMVEAGHPEVALSLLDAVLTQLRNNTTHRA